MRRFVLLIVLAGVVGSAIVAIVSVQPVLLLLAVVLLALGLTVVASARSDTLTMWSEIAAAIGGSLSA